MRSAEHPNRHIVCRKSEGEDHSVSIMVDYTECVPIISVTNYMLEFNILEKRHPFIPATELRLYIGESLS